MTDDWFDADIAAMDLGYGEKAGLQIYRNYTRSFEDHAIKKFVDALDVEEFDLAPLRRLVHLVSTDDARFIPVIACAYADDALRDVFKATLRDDIPGGKSSLLGGYGPLADLSKRIQLAHAFEVMSPDLMLELDHLRVARNAISHSWDLSSMSEFYTGGRVAKMFRVEDPVLENSELRDEFSKKFSDESRFRVRVIWLLCRLAYEAKSYQRAKDAKLTPQRVLYGNPPTKWLQLVGQVAVEATRAISRRT
jgi:hypothetical protein